MMFAQVGQLRQKFADAGIPLFSAADRISQHVSSNRCVNREAIASRFDRGE